MPNHVSNTFRTQKVATLKLLHDNSKDLEGSLAELLMPIPAALAREDWYDWKTDSNNWGTKWGFYEQQFSEVTGGETKPVHKDGKLVGHDLPIILYGCLTFNTAWDKPSANLIHCMQEKFPDLEHWFECESGWGGYRKYEGHELVDYDDYEEPEWEDGIELPGNGPMILYTYLSSTHRDHPKGWYEDYCIYTPVTDRVKINKLDTIKIIAR